MFESPLQRWFETMRTHSLFFPVCTTEVGYIGRSYKVLILCAKHTETCIHTQNNMICIHTQANLYTHNNNFIHTLTHTHTYTHTHSHYEFWGRGCFFWKGLSLVVLMVMIKRFMIMHFMPTRLLPSPLS